MPGDMVSWEAIQYSPVYCSCSDHSLSKMPQDRSAGRAITKCWLRLCLRWSVSYVKTALTRSQRGFPMREVIEGIFEQACNIGLKSNKKLYQRFTENTWEKCRHEKGQNKVEFWRLYMKEEIHVCGTSACWMCILPLLEVYCTAWPHRNPTSWHLTGLSGSMRSHTANSCFQHHAPYLGDEPDWCCLHLPQLRSWRL